MWPLRLSEKASRDRREPVPDSDEGEEVVNPRDEDDHNSSDSDDFDKKEKSRKKSKHGLRVIQPVRPEFKTALDYRT